VVRHQRVHATRVVDEKSYHRYWGGTYSQNVADDNLAADKPVEYQQLNQRYNQMVQDMTEGVSAAKVEHGQVADNQLAHQVTITLV
jgi:hypothetical protein